MANVFISYAKEDKEQARRLVDALRQRGVETWLDEESLLPGQKWRPTIQEAIRKCRYFIAVLSQQSLSKKGYVHKEVKAALEILDEFPENTIFVIPVRIEDCDISEERLKDLHYVDLFPDYEPGLSKILKVLGKAPTDSLVRPMETKYLQSDTKPEYEGAAQHFFGEIESKAEERKRREKEQVSGEVKKSQEIGNKIREIEREAGALVSSFNEVGAGGTLTLQTSDFPGNVFRETGRYRILISFGDKVYWMVRFVTYPDRTLALQLVRVKGEEQASVHDNFMLTNDSINLVFTEDKFWLSLNQEISKDVVSDIIGDLPRDHRSLDVFASTVIMLLRRAIESELILRTK